MKVNFSICHVKIMKILGIENMLITMRIFVEGCGGGDKLKAFEKHFLANTEFLSQ
jgi:hypothetical protein